MNSSKLYAIALVAVFTSVVSAQAPPPPDPEMKAVLDQLAVLGGKPIETLTPAEARHQPTPADAVKALLQKQGKSTAPEPVGKVDNITLAGPVGPIAVRIYTPKGNGPFPMVLYIHGGGWVIADLDTYDASPRALTNAAGAVVVSTEYRHAPEHKFPAAHEDVFAAYQWMLKNAATLQGDPRQVGVVGESAGGNMAIGVCLMARDRGVQLPTYQVLIYPVAQTGFDTQAYKENANAKPLNRAMMQWFFQHTAKSPADSKNPLLALTTAANLKGLPRATVITAQIDPLRSEGMDLANKLKAAGVPVVYKNFDGVTHEFFGMGAVLDKAKAAQKLAADGLRGGYAGHK